MLLHTWFYNWIISNDLFCYAVLLRSQKLLYIQQLGHTSCHMHSYFVWPWQNSIAENDYTYMQLTLSKLQMKFPLVPNQWYGLRSILQAAHRNCCLILPLLQEAIRELESTSCDDELTFAIYMYTLSPIVRLWLRSQGWSPPLLQEAIREL